MSEVDIDDDEESNWFLQVFYKIEDLFTRNTTLIKSSNEISIYLTSISG